MGASDLNESVEDQVAVAVALEDQESPERLAIISNLRRRADADTFRVLTQCVRADDPARQAFALEVLGQFGYEQGRPWLAQTLPVVTAATATSVPAVLEAAIIALGHLGDHHSLPTVLRYVRHHDPVIRFAVACALPKVGGDPFDPVAADGLIELMGDDDAEVRDWATFGLGVQTDVDTPAVRRALTERLDDLGADTSGEALVGLARRRDLSIVPRLLAELAHTDVGNLQVEAAGELGDPRLLAALKCLKESGWAERDVRGSILDEAIRSCQAH